MAKQSDELDDTKRLMGALVRMKPKAARGHEKSARRSQKGLKREQKVAVNSGLFSCAKTFKGYDSL
jgi:hypothetical protein